MKLYAYSVFDSKAGAYLPPFFLQNDEVAKRAFSDCCNDSSHSFSRYAEDYFLFAIGCFDDISGSFVAAPVPVNLGGALTFKRPKVSDNLDLFEEVKNEK